MLYRYRRIEAKDALVNRKISGSASFVLADRMRKLMDDWFLDPVLGFFLPGIGDTVTTVCMLPHLYISVVRLRSFKLTIAILFTLLTDWLLGLLPGVGDIFDVFYRSQRISIRLIKGYMEKDLKTMREIDLRADAFWVLLVVAVLVLYAAFSLLVSFYQWMASLF